jgi:hypothetical protein
MPNLLFEEGTSNFLGIVKLLFVITNRASANSGHAVYGFMPVGLRNEK